MLCKIGWKQKQVPFVVTVDSTEIPLPSDVTVGGLDEWVEKQRTQNKIVSIIPVNRPTTQATSIMFSVESDVNSISDLLECFPTRKDYVVEMGQLIKEHLTRKEAKRDPA